MTDAEFDEFVESLSEEEREALSELLPPLDAEEIQEQVMTSGVSDTFHPRMLVEAMRERDAEEAEVFEQVAKGLVAEMVTCAQTGQEPTTAYLRAATDRLLTEEGMPNSMILTHVNTSSNSTATIRS
jgi:hypothetical protein